MVNTSIASIPILCITLGGFKTNRCSNLVHRELKAANMSNQRIQPYQDKMKLDYSVPSPSWAINIVGEIAFYLGSFIKTNPFKRRTIMRFQKHTN